MVPHALRAAGRLVALLLLLIAAAACAPRLVKPVASAHAPATDALLVLPGFGYSREGADAIREVVAAAEADRIDAYVPRFIDRGGLADSADQLRRFLRQQPLDRYERVHVFAFIAGGWTINPLLEAGELPNLAAIVYDRSPMQERAARVADEKLHLFTWIRYGSPVFDLARTPYPRLTRSGVKVGLLVETAPTRFVSRHAKTVRGYGPLRFECDALGQPYDDCAYLPFSHDQMYLRFAEVWQQVKPFVRSGRFGESVTRRPPDTDPLAQKGRG